MAQKTATADSGDIGFYALYAGKFDSHVGFIRYNGKQCAIEMVDSFSVGTCKGDLNLVDKIAKALQEHRRSVTTPGCGVIVFGPKGGATDGLMMRGVKHLPLSKEVRNGWAVEIGEGRPYVEVTYRIVGLYGRMQLVMTPSKRAALAEGDFWKGRGSTFVERVFKAFDRQIGSPRRKLVFDQRGIGGDYSPLSWMEIKARKTNGTVIRASDGVLEVYDPICGKQEPEVVVTDGLFDEDGVYQKDGDVAAAFKEALLNCLDLYCIPKERMSIDFTGSLREHNSDLFLADIKKALAQSPHTGVVVGFLPKAQEIQLMVGSLLAALNNRSSKFFPLFKAAYESRKVKKEV